MVPTRTQSSGRHVAAPAPRVRAAGPTQLGGAHGVVQQAAHVADHVHVERQRVAGRHGLGQPVGHHDDRPARFDHGLVRQLRVRSWSRMLHEIIGLASLSMKKQKPPVGRYFRRRSVSM